MERELYDEMISVPRAARFPIELRVPRGFRPDDPSTWPRLDGRLEYVGGRLLYMPPCADMQADVVPSIVALLVTWAQTHPEFVVSTNEAGMILGGDTRGADAAVWRRAEVAPYTGKYRRVPPVLAAEVAGDDEEEERLRAKARWYLDHGVAVVWLVLPEAREVIVLIAEDEHRYGGSEQLPANASLPDLEPTADRFFHQLPIR